MAVRFDADGEDYTVALALGNQTAFSICCWVRIAVDLNDWTTAWSMDNGTGDVEILQTQTDGTTMYLFSGADRGNVVAMTVGTWYFIGLVAATSGNTRTAYHKAAGTTALTTVGLTSPGAGTNLANLQLGENVFGTEYLNGNLAAVKLWSGQSLTAEEMAQEAGQYAPVRTANLTGFWPLLNTGSATTDFSGNGRTLSGGTGAATEDGPPIPWATHEPGLILPSGAAATTAIAEVCTGTGAANNASIKVTPNAQNVTGTGAANNAAVSVRSPAGNPAATGVANDAVVTIGDTIIYSASTDIFPNPERGFFQYTETHYLSDNSGHVALNSSTLATDRESLSRTLVFRYFVMEKYRTLDTIDGTYLALVDADLDAIRTAGCKAILRFTYSTSGDLTPPYDADTTPARIMGHIAQLADTLNDYADVIAAVQAGFIGMWGEWYYTDNFGDTGTVTTQQLNDRLGVFAALLDHLDPSIYVLLRYPGLKHGWFE